MINNSILSIPTYLLSCYLVPETVLDKISKLARSFLWGKGGNHSGTHYLGWSTTTLAETEGGLDIRNLKCAKIVLMAKNIFVVFNFDDKLWVHVMNLKYDNLNIWANLDTKNATWFFKVMYETITEMRSNLWINYCNPSTTSFLNDPWCYDVPLVYKPLILIWTSQLRA